MVSIILPTYNERDTLPLLVRQIFSTLEVPCEVIVVDDDSPDRTWELAQQLRNTYPSLKVIRRTEEKGLTSAILRGIKEARGKIICWMDCDLSMPPEILAKMIKEINGYDLVVGSRFLPGGKDARPFSYPKIFSRIINILSQLLLYADFHDYTSGFIAIKKKVIEKVGLEGDYGEYFILLITRAKKLGYKVKEIPYTCKGREIGKSKTAPDFLKFFSIGVKYLKMLIWAFMEKWQRV